MVNSLGRLLSFPEEFAGSAGMFKGLNLAFSDAMYNLVEVYKIKP